MKLFIALEHPHKWVILGQKRQVKEMGTAVDLDHYRVPRNIEQVIGVAPGEKIVCHSIQIPGKRKRYIESALAYALEDRLTDEVENLHFKLLSWRPNDVAYAAVVSRNQITTWIEEFKLYDINLDAIVPDYLLLPQHQNESTTIARLEDGKCCVRSGKYQGLSMDRDGFAYWWQAQDHEHTSYSVNDLALAKQLNQATNVTDEESGTTRTGEISHWKIGEDFPQWLSNTEFDGDIESISVLDGSFSPTHNKKSRNLFKVAGVVAAFGLILGMGSQIFELKMLDSRQQEINGQLRGLFSQHFPDEPYLDRPRSQLTGLIANARAGKIRNDGFQLFMNAVSSIAPEYYAIIEEINFRENEMIVICTVKDLSSLDTIKQAFDEHVSISAELLSSGARDGKVTGRFRLNKQV